MKFRLLQSHISDAEGRGFRVAGMGRVRGKRALKVGAIHSRLRPPGHGSRSAVTPLIGGYETRATFQRQWS